MNNKIVYLLGSLALIMWSCTNTSTPDDRSIVVVEEVTEGNTEGTDTIDIECDSAFFAELNENQKSMTDKERTSFLSGSDFWTGDSLSKQDYLVLFNYLIDHECGDHDDQIADFMFEYFKSKKHFKLFDTYFQLYPDSTILESLTFDLLSAWSNENESITEEDFKIKFPYLYKNGCARYYKSYTALEK